MGKLASIGLQNHADYVKCWQVYEIRSSPVNLKAQLTEGNVYGKRRERCA